MKFLLPFLICLIVLPAFAADKEVAPERDVPIITYGQKVTIVVEAKKNPVVLDVRIEQEKQEISINVIVDKNTDRDMAQYVARNLIMLTKASTLDDPPKDTKTPGKGLYNYHARVLRVDAVVLADGEKMAKKSKIKFLPPLMSDLPIQSRPLTRADGRR